jgi:hypothetical protein
MEIHQNLWQVGGPEYTSPEDAAVYLIRFGIYRGQKEINRFIQSYLRNA